MQITNIISCITYNNTGIGKAVLLSLYTNRETETQSAYATSRNQPSDGGGKNPWI